MLTATAALKKLVSLQPLFILFLLLTSIGLGALCVVRGQTILNLQSRLIEQQDRKIEVVIDTSELATAITDNYVKEKHTHEVRYEQVKGDSETIIKENTVFLNTCISDVGVQHYNQYVSASIVGEPKDDMRESGSTE